MGRLEISATVKSLVRLTSAAVLALALSAPIEAVAQQKAPAPKAAPKGQTQQQAEPPPKASAAEQPPLIYTNWTKVCAKSQDAGGKTMCRIGKDGRLESGAPMVGAVIAEVEGEARKVLQIMLPLGILLPRGTRIVVDSDEQGAIVLPIVVCAGGGCMAQAEASPEMVAKMKKGQNLFVQAYNMAQSVMTLSLPLGDFAKAYDGPPTDPKDVEEKNKKLQEQLEKAGKDRIQQQKR